MNPDTRTLTWIITSVDEVTGGLPEDPLAGFLPPNDDQHRGEGFVCFSVRLQPGLPSGTVIRNEARITFDVNEPIDTNEAVHTIDLGPPTSGVNPLPATSPLTFTVTWSGDDAGGSGIASYDIYISTDGGAFLTWLGGISSTQATFTGTVGSTYGFYSVATDHVGHRQATPTGAQATVTIIESKRYIYLPLVMCNFP